MALSGRSSTQSLEEFRAGREFLRSEGTQADFLGTANAPAITRAAASGAFGGLLHGYTEGQLTETSFV